MSLKPPKKSDLGKSWMKNRRDKARMIQPEYHLIASEGTETQCRYSERIDELSSTDSPYCRQCPLPLAGFYHGT